MIQAHHAHRQTHRQRRDDAHPDRNSCLLLHPDCPEKDESEGDSLQQKKKRPVHIRHLPAEQPITMADQPAQGIQHLNIPALRRPCETARQDILHEHVIIQVKIKIPCQCQPDPDRRSHCGRREKYLSCRAPLRSFRARICRCSCAAAVRICRGIFSLFFSEQTSHVMSHLFTTACRTCFS